MSAPNPFRFLDAVSDTKVDLFAEGAQENEYQPFLINRGLSYHIDTVLYAAEMNVMGHLPPKLQHDYFLHSLRKRKRWAKWSKADIELKEKCEIISAYLNISCRKAMEIHDLFDDEQIKKMKEQRKNE